jgi:predicted dehydrogenase
VRGALAIEADHFVAVARGDADPLCTAEDGVEAVRVSLAMEASAEYGRPVDLADTVR